MSDPRIMVVKVPQGTRICRICLTSLGGIIHSAKGIGSDALTIQLHDRAGITEPGWRAIEDQVSNAIGANVRGEHDVDAHETWEAQQLEEAVEDLRRSVQALARESLEVDELEARDPGWSIPAAEVPGG